MILPFEQLLVLGAIGIYLFDSALLLQPNQLVMVCGGGRWRFALPSARWEILRQQPYLPNPLTPHRGLFRATWYPVGGTTDCAALETRQALLAAMRPIQIASLLLLSLFGIGLPVALLVVHSDIAFVQLLALMYAVILFMLAVVAARRHLLALSRAELAKLAFDALVCAPLAINMVRRISLRHSLAGDPLALATGSGRDALARSMAAQLSPRVSEMLEIVDDEESHAGLVRFQQQLQDMQK